MFTGCLRAELVRRAEASTPVRPGTPSAQMDRALLLNHVAGSFVELVIWWAQDDFRADPHRLAQDYLRAITPLFRSAAE